MPLLLRVQQSKMSCLVFELGIVSYVVDLGEGLTRWIDWGRLAIEIAVFRNVRSDIGNAISDSLKHSHRENQRS